MPGAHIYTTSQIHRAESTFAVRRRAGRTNPTTDVHTVGPIYSVTNPLPTAAGGRRWCRSAATVFASHRPEAASIMLFVVAAGGTSGHTEEEQAQIVGRTRTDTPLEGRHSPGRGRRRAPSTTGRRRTVDRPKSTVLHLRPEAKSARQE